LSAILDNFMKFARPGAMTPHPVDIQVVVAHVLTLMEFEAEERKIRLEKMVDERLPIVLGDETQISQVLVNIVVNAFQAMPDGGTCRILASRREAHGKQWVEISIQDTGAGVKEEELPRLFEPFYTTKSSGSGLGLAIAYRIIQDHGGTIEVSSIAGSGVTVLMKFPVTMERSQSCGVTS